ncbi:hypothetical protein AB0D45_00260 [Streptomyces sp. NPDC048352]|uniref:hypothetical protein n=1 Tax=Streptomyces sp. NPDC048352 TaxID=3154718 RepID=UPI00343930DF
MNRTSGVRLLLEGAVAVLLLVCIVSVWAPPPAHASFASPVAAACGVAGTPAPVARAAVWPGGLEGRTVLLLFSTAAIGAAVGLVTLAGRRL